MMDKQGFWDKLKWKMLMFKIRFDLWITDLKLSYLLEKHCNKGFHKLSNEGDIYTIYRSSIEVKIKSTYFICKICHVIFFPTDKDQKNYNLIQKKMDDNMRLLVKQSVKNIKDKKFNKDMGDITTS